MNKVKGFFSGVLNDTKILLRNVPPIAIALFLISVVGMNLLANKSIDFGVEWLAADCGILLSWLYFLSMDMITKRFGPYAATMVSILGLLVSLLMSLIFFIASYIPGIWSESFIEGSEDVINTALNNTFRGTWYIILGSATAYTISAIINNLLNYSIGKLFKKNPDGVVAFMTRSYVSTLIAQFIDNLIFSLIVSKIFFGWTFLQCISASLIGCVIELLCEVVFSPIGYKISKKWKREGIGQEYVDYIKNKRNKDESISNGNI